MRVGAWGVCAADPAARAMCGGSADVANLGTQPEMEAIYVMWRSTRVLVVGLLCLAPELAVAGAKIEISEDRWVTIGAGVRTSFSVFEDADSDDGVSEVDDQTDFDLESFRFYSGGQLFKSWSVEFNAEYDGNQEVRVLDGIVKFEYGDMVNFWAGRFLPPSDRANLSGPYYLNSFDFPFVQQYPAIFAGRDEGFAYFGQVGEGMFKWQLGAFDGNSSTSESDDELLYAGRFTLNLWDPEPGYYNSSTYYGEKDILAIGLVGMTQKDGASQNVLMAPTLASLGIDPTTQIGDLTAGQVQSLLSASPTSSTLQGDFTGWNVDFLLEKKMDFGVVTLEGAYYDYDLDDIGGVANEGDGYFVVASLLLPQQIGSGTFRAKLQPIVRFQEFDPENGLADDHTRVDIGLNLIFDGHNARLSLLYARDDGSPFGAPGQELDDRGIFKIGLQIQL
jgi:hypothetical protein